MESSNKKKEAKKHYELSIDFFNQNQPAHYRLGVMLYGEGNEESALSHFKTSIEINANHAESHYYTAMIMRVMKMPHLPRNTSTKH